MSEKVQCDLRVIRFGCTQYRKVLTSTAYLGSRVSMNATPVVATTKYHSLHIIMIHDSIPFTYLVLTSAGNKIKYWLIQF